MSGGLSWSVARGQREHEREQGKEARWALRRAAELAEGGDASG